ncbi:AAA-type ATPase family protein [Striga asiatica]|uniref:AAA-type ATPase family protein n=1 Tax=Striga asiatica TaxID=4170 RepID=A0A5A7QIU9_STRAF|nr:AAA-type ATPase family protein [Striga asiatica]
MLAAAVQLFDVPPKVSSASHVNEYPEPVFHHLQLQTKVAVFQARYPANAAEKKTNINLKGHISRTTKKDHSFIFAKRVASPERPPPIAPRDEKQPSSPPQQSASAVRGPLSPICKKTENTKPQPPSTAGHGYKPKHHAPLTKPATHTTTAMASTQKDETTRHQ